MKILHGLIDLIAQPVERQSFQDKGDWLTVQVWSLSTVGNKVKVFYEHGLNTEKSIVTGFVY